MRKSRSRLTVLIFLFSLTALTGMYGQQNNDELEKMKESAPKVFFDCWRCDRDFIRDNITYINFVRDRADADVHILVTNQSTGSQGQEYTFTFIGLKDFEGVKHTLTYSSGPSDTRDETRRGQLEIIKRGLFPFVVEHPLANYIFLDFKKRLKPTSVVDPWKSWVFSVNLDGRISGEASRNSRSLDVNLSANKVTPEFKVRIGLSADYDRREYNYDEETIISKSDQMDATFMAVKSLGPHWSVGGWFEVESSSYSNLNYQVNLSPAIEFNIFPYSMSTRRQLRFLYKVGWNRANYNEETVYSKISETLFNESLNITFEMREPWGNASTYLEGSHYFHDFKKNRLELGGSVDFRLFKGFSINVRGRYERIHDQLSLPKGEASVDEVLLRIKELATNYDYSVSVGIRYTFGSVYSNVVNPRFGRNRFRGYMMGGGRR